MSKLVKNQKMNRGTEAAATMAILAILGILVLGGVFVAFVLPEFGIDLRGQIPSTQAPVSPPPSGAGTAFWVGDVTPSIRGTDTLVSGTNYQCAAAMTCTWYYNRGSGSGMPTSGYIATGIAGNSTFYLDPLDKGTIYLEVLSNAPGTLLQDVKRTLNVYAGRVVGFGYINIDSDTAKEMVYKVNAADIRPSAGGSTAATLSFALFVANYQAPTFAYNKPSSSPETGIGTAANQTRLLVEYTFANTGRVFPVNNIRIVINASEASYTIDSVKISVYGSNGFTTLELTQSDFDRQVGTFAASTGATVGGNTKNVTWTKSLCATIDCFNNVPAATVYSTSTTKVFGIEILITFRLNSGDIRFIQVGLEGLNDDESVVTGKFAVRYFRA